MKTRPTVEVPRELWERIERNIAEQTNSPVRYAGSPCYARGITGKAELDELYADIQQCCADPAGDRQVASLELPIDVKSLAAKADELTRKYGNGLTMRQVGSQLVIEQPINVAGKVGRDVGGES